MINEIDFLAWDSKFFKRRVGRLNLELQMSLGNLLQSAHQQGYDLLYIYSSIPIENSSYSHYNLLDVGGHILFSKDLTGHDLERTGLSSDICEYQRDTLTPELLEIALLSGHLSRFKIDPFLPVGRFECLYETWMKNILINRPKSSIFTYYANGSVAGLITCEFHEAKCIIGLLAVSQLYQGQGIATKLIMYLQNICIAQNIASIEVKTQLSNTSARALYQKNLFIESQRSLIYHAHYT